MRNKNLNFYPIFLPADNQKTPAINLDTANWTQNKKSGAEKWQKCLQEMVRYKSISLYFPPILEKLQTRFVDATKVT